MHQKIAIPLVVEASTGEMVKIGQAVLTYIGLDYVDIVAKITGQQFVDQIRESSPAQIVLGGMALEVNVEESEEHTVIHDHEHIPKDHKDGKPPYCDICGLTAENVIPLAMIPPQEEGVRNEGLHITG